ASGAPRCGSTATRPTPTVSATSSCLGCGRSRRTPVSTGASGPPRPSSASTTSRSRPSRRSGTLESEQQEGGPRGPPSALEEPERQRLATRRARLAGAPLLAAAAGDRRFAVRRLAGAFLAAAFL